MRRRHGRAGTRAGRENRLIRRDQRWDLPLPHLLVTGEGGGIGEGGVLGSWHGALDIGQGGA